MKNEPSMRALRELDLIPELFEQKTKKKQKTKTIFLSLMQYSKLTKEMATFESYRIQQSASVSP